MLSKIIFIILYFFSNIQFVSLIYFPVKHESFFGQCSPENFSPPKELKDPQCRDEMAAARGALKKNATMLYTASQAFLRHPDVAATRANRDYVFKQVQEAIGGISSAAQATSPTDEKHGHAGIGELAAALNEFDVSHCSLFKIHNIVG